MLHGIVEHKPVMVAEVIDGLAIKPDGIYVDGTFGRGGHSKAILERLSARGRLYAVDKDPEAIEVAKKNFADDARFHFNHTSFVDLVRWLNEEGVLGRVNGLLLDLGVSSPQLENSSRGFSFLRDGPLDMRMNPEEGLSAKDWINEVKLAELISVLRNYGEERYAKRIANAIIKERVNGLITTTRQLAEIISKASLSKEKSKHPATRSFQAIRIYVNRELEELRAFLLRCLSILAANGRLVIISFHSLEDRIVKRFMKNEERGDDFPKDLPVQESELCPRLKRIGRAIRPTEEEVKTNSRARSAILRIAEKL